jgi:hypothetical protein
VIGYTVTPQSWRFSVSGKPINSAQIKVYNAERSKGKIQKTAAAIAGISERSGRRIEKGELHPGGNQKRAWRTHPDFFAGVWEIEIVPLLMDNSTLKATALFKYLQKKYPGQYEAGKLRTFQRRVSRWKHLHCRDREMSRGNR